MLMGLLLQWGCILIPAPTPEEWASQQTHTPRDDPPRARVFVGEIRDHATFALEPAAMLEFWSEDPTYLPVAQLDGLGRYSVRVDVCRQDAGLAEQVANDLVFHEPKTCLRWIGRFQIRARLGTRCSLPEPADLGSKVENPLVLWLGECHDLGRGGRSWHAVKVAGRQSD
jgi:hypothetical protein